MFRKIYRAMVLAQAASAANRLLQFSSPRMLEDIVKETFIADTIANVQAEFDAEDAAKAKAAPVNANLAGAV